MSDPLEKLEAELASLRPVAPSPAVAQRIADELQWSLADRVLAATMSCGALAACLIVGLLTWQSIAPASAQQAFPPQVATASPQTIGQYQQALARADSALFTDLPTKELTP